MPIRTLAAVVLLGASSAAWADALLDRLVADARAVGPDDFAWTRSLRTEQRSGDEVEVRTIVERYDPSRPAKQRWTLVSVDGRAPTSEEQQTHAKASARAIVPSYGRIAGYFGSGAQRAEAAGRTVYRAPRLPKGSLLLNRTDLSDGARAEAIVADTPKPFIERLSLASTKPARIMLVAKVDRLDAMTRYKLLPDGRPVIVEQTSETHGSMMGRSGTIRTVATFTDHRAVRPLAAR